MSRQTEGKQPLVGSVAEYLEDAAARMAIAPIVARTRSFYRRADPVAYDCVKLIVVRDGSTILFSEFGQQPVKLGDVIVLSANTLCGSEPEGHITVTTIDADTDYVIDQVFWQHVSVLQDRLHAQDFAATIYTEPAQISSIAALSLVGGGNAGFQQAFLVAAIAAIAAAIISSIMIPAKR